VLLLLRARSSEDSIVETAHITEYESSARLLPAAARLVLPDKPGRAGRPSASPESRPSPIAGTRRRPSGSPGRLCKAGHVARVRAARERA